MIHIQVYMVCLSIIKSCSSNLSSFPLYFVILINQYFNFTQIWNILYIIILSEYIVEPILKKFFLSVNECISSFDSNLIDFPNYIRIEHIQDVHNRQVWLQWAIKLFPTTFRYQFIISINHWSSFDNLILIWSFGLDLQVLL